jgi:hypothetical protein
MESLKQSEQECDLGTSALKAFWAATFRVKNNKGKKGRNDKYRNKKRKRQKRGNKYRNKTERLLAKPRRKQCTTIFMFQ